MKKNWIMPIIVGISIVFLATSAYALILKNIVELDSDNNNLEEGYCESNEVIFLLREQMDYMLTTDLAVNFIEAGDYEFEEDKLSTDTPSIIPSGNTISSWLLHYDPDDEDPDSYQEIMEPMIDFGEETILGVIVSDSLLWALHSTVGIHHGVKYSEELGDGLEEGDYIEIDGDMQSLKIKKFAASDGEIDQLRIITTGTSASIPQPSSMILIASALVGCGILKRRQKES